MSWKPSTPPLLEELMFDDPVWKARVDASQRWVSTLGIGDRVVREAIVAVRAQDIEDLKAKIVCGDLLKQRGMGPSRMAVARKIAGCEIPAPPAHFKDAVLMMLEAASNTTSNEVLSHDLRTMRACLRDYGNVTDCKLYNAFARSHFALAAQRILGA